MSVSCWGRPGRTTELSASTKEGETLQICHLACQAVFAHGRTQSAQERRVMHRAITTQFGLAGCGQATSVSAGIHQPGVAATTPSLNKFNRVCSSFVGRFRNADPHASSDVDSLQDFIRISSGFHPGNQG